MTVNKEKAISTITEIRKDLQLLIQKYSVVSAEISPNEASPHTPVIACVQMALIQEAVTHFIVSGFKMEEAVMLAFQTTQNSIGTWASKVIKMQAPPPQKSKKILRPKRKLILPGE